MPRQMIQPPITVAAPATTDGTKSATTHVSPELRRLSRRNNCLSRLVTAPPEKKKRVRRRVTPHEPVAVTINEALRIVPCGRSTLCVLLKEGTIKSKLVLGIRCIDYKSLKAHFATP